MGEFLRKISDWFLVRSEKWDALEDGVKAEINSRTRRLLWIAYGLGMITVLLIAYMFKS